ncbi:MAG: hypothetical protein ACR2H9_10295 [Longimicrobiaceae bacterium]
MRAALLVLAVLLVSCNSPAPDPPAAAASPASADTSVVRRTGTVRVVGSAPVNVEVTLQDESNRRVAVGGPLAEEIGRLSGAVVEVQGRLLDGRMQATGYQIRSVNGAPALTGTVERAEGGGLQLRTEAGEVIHLSGAQPHLRAGQKVWVQGTRTMQVQSYGVIRP